MEGLGVRALKRPWRVIVSEPGSGPWNMALDEALAQSVRDGGLPFVRFYTWNPGTLSLGRFQNPETGLSSEARRRPRVRRTTGGGAIWHDDEQTYSLGCTQGDLGLTGVKASFELLAGFLLDTWNDLGWNACFAKDLGGGGLGTYAPACFAGTEEYDILVDGRKLGGNAQSRGRTMIFQHGSIPVRLDHGMLERLFLPEDRPLAGSVTDLTSCGWLGNLADLRAHLTRSLVHRLEVEGVEGEPSPAEVERAEILVDTKYGSVTWTETGGGTLRDR